MKIVIELTDEDVRFLLDNDVDTLFHCCGQGATGTDQNMELQRRLAPIIEEQITAQSVSVKRCSLPNLWQ